MSTLDTIDLKVLGQRLREAREKANITVSDAARHIESVTGGIEQIEAGNVRIMPADLLKLSALYRTQVYLLLNGPLPYQSENEAMQAYLDPEKMMSEGMLAHFLGVDRLECRKRVLAYVAEHHLNVDWL